MKQRIILAGVLFLALISSHQNCTPPVVQHDQKLEGLADSSPFAFDVTVNRLAYMSCSNMKSLNQSGFFTFKVSATQGSGLMLTQDYLDHVNIYSTSDKKEILSHSENATNIDAQLVLAVRNKDNLDEIYGPEGEGGKKIARILGKLTDSDYVDWLFSLDDDERGYEFANSDGDKDELKGSLNFADYPETEIDGLRSYISKGAQLTLTYTSYLYSSSDDLLPRTPSDRETDAGSNKAVKTAYGVGFDLNLVTPKGYSQQTKRSLFSVDEYNLETQKPQGNWKCFDPYIIVRLEDIKAKCNGDAIVNWCKTNPDPATLSDEQKRVRDVLSVDDWYVDWKHRCIVRKEGTESCYGSSNSGTEVGYNITYDAATDTTSNSLGSLACSPYGGTSGSSEIPDDASKCWDNKIKLCPHFVTVCYREE